MNVPLIKGTEVKIEGQMPDEGPLMAHNVHVYLNGYEVTQLLSFKAKVIAGQPVSIKMEFIPDKYEINVK